MGQCLVRNWYSPLNWQFKQLQFRQTWKNKLGLQLYFNVLPWKARQSLKQLTLAARLRASWHLGHTWPAKLPTYFCSLHLWCKPESACRLFGGKSCINESEIKANACTKDGKIMVFEPDWPVCMSERYLNKITTVKVLFLGKYILYNDLLQSKLLSPSVSIYSNAHFVDYRQITSYVNETLLIFHRKFSLSMTRIWVAPWTCTRHEVPWLNKVSLSRLFSFQVLLGNWFWCIISG